MPEFKNPYKLPCPTSLSFSGGRTSGYLLRKVLDAYDGVEPPHVITTFANTGREDERTLEFVQECSERWNVRVYWVEYCRNEKARPVVWEGKKPLVGQYGFRTVTFATASRNGEPFEQLIDTLTAYRANLDKEPTLPNPVQRYCSSLLKVRTMEKFLTSIGIPKYSAAIGIRYDEPSRAAPLLSCGNKYGKNLLPLYDSRVVQSDVMDFWAAQPFDLGLKHDPVMGTYEGNCDLCFLKRTDKIKRLAVERPEAVKWWAAQEARTGANFRRGRFTYTDIVEGRVSLPLMPDDACGEQEACFCTD